MTWVGAYADSRVGCCGPPVGKNKERARVRTKFFETFEIKIGTLQTFRQQRTLETLGQVT